MTEAVLRDANPRIAAAIHPEEGLFADITLTLVVFDEARSLIEETLAALPDAAEVATIRAELEAWDGDMADAAATLEAQSRAPSPGPRIRRGGPPRCPSPSSRPRR